MSFEFELDESDVAKADLIAAVGKDLQALFAKRRSVVGLTQTKVADELGVDKSRVNRCLSGHANLTLSTVADITRVMKGRILIKIVPEEEAGRWAIHWTNSSQILPNAKSESRKGQPVSGAPLQATAGYWK
ncbi:helix-turn-helix domain-containing protein [Agrobacterium tumefaciens]|uniref:helix-turn-helix domain-containing protein n=1 Tax=Agrobacterium tumefaciens TaxID=358 RepID=UPI000DD35150|nr:helix-turn-helix transcriptional regulator [Agrobacterium tumefaciens]MDP9872331.1 DNA-binding transcriptional regulator YdaS (Cro superfamily) [Agrobacterium tumefaciens]MDP9975947.1 DNA-binding transcriptional regulator YdaS (Cro superfamily) [Agrobacterium tumefaciens]